MFNNLYILNMEVDVGSGKLYIPKDLREKFGEKFEMIALEDRIVLIPLSDDPLADLREESKNVDKSVQELKKEALEEGIEEAGN